MVWVAREPFGALYEYRCKLVLNHIVMPKQSMGQVVLRLRTALKSRTYSTPTCVYLDYTYYINILEDAYGC